jgi:hypothetical protein
MTILLRETAQTFDGVIRASLAAADTPGNAHYPSVIVRAFASSRP